MMATRRRADSNRAIFRPKDSSRTRPAAMTVEGYAAFERARAWLARLAGRKDRVSDADVIEALARGEAETRRYLRGKQETRTP